MTPRDRPVALIGVPTDVGAGQRGASMGPEALRVAGIVQSLRALGWHVDDRGNLAGPMNPESGAVDGYRHLPEVASWCEATRDACAAALGAGEIPILMGGDHSFSIGSIAAVAACCAEARKPLTVLWLDAHADFNTAASSPTGNLHGMPAAVVTGHGPQVLLRLGHARPMLDPSRLIQVGVRAVDEVEKQLLVQTPVVVYDMRQIDELRMRTVMEKALAQAAADGGHLHVSLDVDFLDPAIAPGVPTTVPGGPTYREAQLAAEMIYDSGLLGSLDIAELNPAFDEGNRTAVLVVELVASLFGARILARPHGGSSRTSL